MRVEPKRAQIKGSSTAINGFKSSGDARECSYKNEPATPLIAPTYIIPGIPRLR